MSSPRRKVQEKVAALRNGKAHRPASQTDPPAIELVTITASSIIPEKVRWLWPLHIPYGMLSELIGDPGLAKSTITADWAARTTNGWDFPPGKGASGEPGSVLYLSAEDSAKHTIRPRLGEANANLDRVEILDCVRVGDHRGPLILPAHLPQVRAKMDRMKCKLVIVDPVTAFIGTGIDANSDKDVRSTLLYPLKDLAEEFGAAVVLVRHLNKGSGKAVYRGGGSIAFSGAVRVSLAVGKSESGQRYLTCVKSNVGREPKAIEYNVEESDDGSRVVWGDECELSADDLLAALPARGGRTNEAESWLRDLLSGGPVPADTVWSKAEASGQKRRTVERAKESLGVRVFRQGFGPKGTWMWEAPASAADIPP